jgi:DNA repair protein RadD
MKLCKSVSTAGIYSASLNRKNIRKITYATIGSIKNIGEQFKELGFTKMLIDECHLYPREANSMIGKFIRDSEIPHILGITATPVKLQQNFTKDGEQFSKLVMLTSRSKKGNFFKKIIHIGQISEMIELGYWSPLRYIITHFDCSLLVYYSEKSEYTDASIERAFAANDIHTQIIQQLNENSDRKHILVFVPSVQEAIMLSEQYANSAAIYGDMCKEIRARTIQKFRAGEIRVIFNVRVLSTGFDYTGIDCIILGNSTASIGLYYQIIGRGTRIDANKKDCLIIDLAGNVERFGRVEDIRYEQGTIWRMFGTDNKLLSGIPVHEIGNITSADVERIEQQRIERKVFVPMETMPNFGKYKNQPIKDIPHYYKKWVLENLEWSNRNEKLRKSIEYYLYG